MSDDDVLSEEELEALSEEAADRDEADDGSARAISLETFERRVRLPLPGLDAVAETFAEDAAPACGRFMGQVVEIRPEAMRGSSLEDYTHSLDIPSHITPVEVSGGLSGRLLVVLDAAVVDRLVERRFGGRGGRSGQAASRRALSTAERRLGEDLVTALGAELERALKPLAEVTLAPGHAVGSPRLARPVTGPRDPVILMPFTVGFGDAEGRIELAVPQDLLRPVDSTLRAGLPDRPGGSGGSGHDSLRRAAADIELELVARVNAQALTLRQVSALQPGDVLAIDAPAEAVRLLTGEVTIAVGGFGVAGECNAIRVDRMLIDQSVLGTG